MKVWLRRIAKTLGVLLLICLLLVLGVYLVLQHRGVRKFAVDKILSQVNSSLLGHIEVDRIEGPLLGAATVKGIRIFDGRDNLAAELEEASLHFRLQPLLRGQIQIARLEASTGTAVVRFYDEGTINWMTLTAPSEETDEPAQVPIFVDTIRLSDMAIIYLDESQKLADEPARSAWRHNLSQILDQTRQGEELRARFLSYFTPEIIAPFAGPAAPVAALIQELELSLSAQIYGTNIGAELEFLRAQAQAEILPEALSLSISDLDFSMSATTLEADVEAFDIDRWLSARELSASLILPPPAPSSPPPAEPTQPQPNGIGGVAEPGPNSSLFELLAADLGRWTFEEPLFHWALPDIALANPISLEAQLSADPDLASLLATINAASIDEPILITARVDDYLSDTPRYKLSVQTDNFESNAWLPEISPVSIKTDLTALVDGSGIDLETLSAHLRARQQNILIDDTYEAHLVSLDISADQKRITSHQIAALTPYLDLFAAIDLDLDGEAHLRARTTADAAQTEAASKIVGTNITARPTRADLSVEALARFSPTALDEPLNALHSLQTSAEWAFSGFQAEDIHIGSSRGAFALELGQHPATDGAVEYRGQYTIDAAGRRIRSPFGNLTAFELQDQGSLAASLPLDDPLTGLRRFENQARLNLTGLQTPQLELDTLTLAAALTKQAPRANQIDGKFKLQATGALSSGFFVDEAKADFSAQVTLRQSDSPLEMIRSFAWQGELQAQQLRSESLELEAAHLKGELNGTLKDPVGQLLLELENLELPGQSLSSVALNLNLPGEGQATLDLDGRRAQGGSYHLGAHLNFTPYFESFSLTALELGSDRTRWATSPGGVLTWTGSEVLAETFHLENSEQTLQLDGRFTPNRNQDLGLAIGALDLGELRQGFYLEELLPQVHGKLTFEANLEGSARSPRASTTLALKDFHFEDLGPMSLDFAAAYEAERLLLEDLTLQAYEQPILVMSAAIPVLLDLQGRAQVLWEEHLELHLATSELRLGDFHEAIPALYEYDVDGLFAATLDASGRVDDPRIALEFALEGFRFQGMLGAQDDNLESSPATASVPQNTQSPEYIEIQDINLKGALSYHSRRTGGDGLHAHTSVFWEDELAMEALIESPLPLEEWAQAALDPTGDAPRWRNEFLGLPFRLRLHLPTLELNRIPLESLQAQNITGQAKVELDLTGTLGDPRGEVDLAFTSVGFDRFRELDFQLQANLRDHVASFEHIDFRWGGDEIFTANGAVPLPIAAFLAGEVVDDLPIDFRIQLQELPISRLSPIDYGFARLRGSIAAFLEVDGSLRSPKFRSRAGLFNTMLGDGSAGSIYMELLGADNEITIHSAACHRLDPFLTIDGKAPVHLDLVALALGEDWRLPGELALRIHGEEIALASDLPLQLLSDIIVDPSGTLAIDLQGSGTWEEPNLNGFIEMKDGALTLPEFSRRFTGIAGRIDIDEDSVSIPGFAVNDGPSKAFLSGQIEHEFFIPQNVDIELETDQFNIGGIGVDFPVFLTSKVEVSGEPIGEPGRLKIHISDLEVRLTDEWDQNLHPTDLDDDIIVLGSDRGGPRQAAQVVKADSPLDALHLILAITIDRDAWAHHPNGSINLAADITAELTGRVIAITGNIEALRGDLEFLGRQFVVRKSQITFIGAAPPDPRLQLEADHPMDRAVTQSLGPPSSGEPRIIVRITGTASAPRLELRSDPAMTDTEILSVLMTGRPPDRSDVGQDEGVASQALAAVGGLFFGLLQEELAGTVPVDVLRLDPVVPGTEGGRLEVGKYITSDLFLSYRRQFGADEDVASNVIRLEYHFLPRWMVELLYTDRNEGGLNIYWDVY